MNKAQPHFWDLLQLALNPHQMTGEACTLVITDMVTSGRVKRRDLEVHVEKARTTNDCRGSNYDEEVENRCMDVLDLLEKMRRERGASRKQLQKQLDRETKWRHALGEEVVSLRARVIELEDRVDPTGATQRASDRAMREAIADQEQRNLLFGSGESSKVTGILG